MRKLLRADRSEVDWTMAKIDDNRDSLTRLRDDLDKPEQLPSYWNMSHNIPAPLNRRGNPKMLVNVDKATKKAIEKLINATWEQELVGKGADAKGLNHNRIKVLSVQRVENPALFNRYQDQRKLLLEKMIRGGEPSRPIGYIKGTKGDLETTKELDDFMKSDLIKDINEHYLLHGTKVERIPALVRHGLDPKHSSPDAMFGKGIYAAESSTKADQYADTEDKRRPHKYRNKMILSRMLLGNVFLCNENHKSVANRYGPKLSGPPCMKCLEDRCRCAQSEKFDSVMGDRHLRFREFVVYKKEQIYPEYVITYKRSM
ncbi:unnamed protein product [Lymnaea stagnalis]|uniref:Poly [ADP-ribose] polymerase n=1 Tax=Lymnaea stagnalis TaxID=6523 RepID=A0AAV2HND9_LYMST